MNQVHIDIMPHIHTHMLALAGANEPTPDTWLKSNVDVIFLAFRPIPFHSQFVCILYVAVFVSGSVFVAPMGERVRACVRVSLSLCTRYTIHNSKTTPHKYSLRWLSTPKLDWTYIINLHNQNRKWIMALEFNLYVVACGYFVFSFS